MEMHVLLLITWAACTNRKLLLTLYILCNAVAIIAITIIISVVSVAAGVGRPLSYNNKELLASSSSSIPSKVHPFAVFLWKVLCSKMNSAELYLFNDQSKYPLVSLFSPLSSSTPYSTQNWICSTQWQWATAP